MLLTLDKVADTFVEKDLPKLEIQKRKRYICNHVSDDMKQYRKDWYNRIHKGKKVKVQCECGCMISYHGISNHRKSDKHKALLNKKEN